jgi:TonB family protein
MSLKTIASFVVVVLLAATGRAQSRAPLDIARDLYASAAYEDALSALSRVAEGSPELAQQVDEYRAFSLFALGRTAEAESVVEAVIRRDPLASPDPRDASPRIVEMFGQVRKRLLPELIRDGYRSARTTIDKGETLGAVPQLTRVKRMLDQAKLLGVMDPTLADLDVLVNGFLDLARSVADLTAAATSAKAPAPSPAAPTAAAAAAGETVVNRPPPSGPVVYSAGDTNVIGPQAIRQQVPAIPYSVARSIASGQSTGILEVLIDEKGEVESAIMREPVNPIFDATVLAAARTWRYRPATKDGKPVKYVKRIGVSAAGAGR